MYTKAKMDAQHAKEIYQLAFNDEFLKYFANNIYVNKQLGTSIFHKLNLNSL